MRRELPASDAPRQAIRDAVAGGQPELPRRPPIATRAPRARQFDGLRVLLVEDSSTNLLVARKMLRSLGCEVREARDGREALNVLSEQRFDVVLMDCQMPVMDGYAATSEYRRSEADGLQVPIIALTASDFAEDRYRCLDAGMNGYLSKPFTRRILIETLSRWAPYPKPESGPEAPARQDLRGEDAIDPAALEQIASLDPESADMLLAEVIASYVKNAESLMVALRKAYAANDAAAVARASHTLKSSSANVGATRFADLCKTIEASARRGELVRAELDRVTQEFEAALAALDRTRERFAA